MTEQDRRSRAHDATAKERSPKFPDWIRRPWASGDAFFSTKAVLGSLRLNTVCQSARCPNLGECWQRRTATFMIMGNLCSRNCRYCSVPSGNPAGQIDHDEPERIAEAATALEIRHVVITSVTRDDLEDGGAAHFARTIRAVKASHPDSTIEVLTPDFQGSEQSVEIVLEAGPDVFGHNIETVRRLCPILRGTRCLYDTGLNVLRAASRMGAETVVKSALMLGHGETQDEVIETLRDLRSAGCEAVALGQYLRPGRRQTEVVEYIHPEQFRQYEREAYALGFAFVVAGPFVRSSYRSEEMMRADFAGRRRRTAPHEPAAGGMSRERNDPDESRSVST